MILFRKRKIKKLEKEAEKLLDILAKTSDDIAVCSENTNLFVTAIKKSEYYEAKRKFNGITKKIFALKYGF